MKQLIMFIAVLILTGCATTLASFKKPANPQYFVLTQDHLRVRVGGLIKTKWAEGLRAGTYILEAENNEGRFFVGPPDCVIIMSKDQADRYEQRGEIASLDERNRVVLVPTTGLGGVWLPKPGVKKEPLLFQDQHNRTNGAAGGLVVMAITSLTEGNLIFFHYIGESEFLTSLPIVDGAPPSSTSSSP